MLDSDKISRRDWFRLRPRRSDPSESVITAQATPCDPGPTVGETPNALRPIAHPQNHHGMNLADLPPMREALLTEEQVRQLFYDIETLASDILLMQRSSRSQRATAPGATATTAEQLRAAQELLVLGTVSRVQIRYHWQSAHWIDTLERRETGVRLIRIAHG
jgi:hypothetical protein